MRKRAAVVVFGSVLALGIAAGCSSSGTSFGCTCDVTNNGQSKTLQCGQSACVGGMTAKCSSTSETSIGDPCTTTFDSGAAGTSSGTSGGTSGSSNGCGLFKCTASKDCGGIAPCFSTNTATSYCYEQEGNASECSKDTTATTKTTSNGPTTICVPATCPAPDKFLP